MKITTHAIFLELIYLQLKQAKNLKDKFKNVDIKSIMKKSFEASRDSVSTIKFTKYDYKQQKFLWPYITKLVNYLTEEELTLLNERLKTAKVKNGYFSFKNAGVYYVKDNKLIYYKKRQLVMN